jgi:hypothetical protein
MKKTRIIRIIMCFIILSLVSYITTAATTLLFPQDNIIIHNEPTFLWTSTNFSTYTFILATDAALSTPIINVTDINQTSYMLASPLENRSYYWMITGANDTPSGVQSFSVNMTPAHLTLVSPSQSAIINEVTQNFTILTDKNATCRFNSVKAGSNSESDYLAKGQPMTISGGISHSSVAGLLYEGINSFYILCNTSQNNQITKEFNVNITRDILGPIIEDESWTNINVNSIGNINITLNVTDISNIVTANIRYKKWSQEWTSWIALTYIYGTPQTGNIYNYIIPEDNWSSHGREDILFEVFFEDSLNQNTTQQYTETIERSENRPNITIPTTKIGQQGEQISFNITVDDADNDDIHFSCNFSAITINKIARDKATVTWTPLSSDIGNYNVRFNIFDGIYNETMTVTFVINDINDAPVINHEDILTFTTYTYRIFNFTINATDVDINDTLTYESNSDIFQISRTNGEIRAFPTDSAKGEYEVNITVTDNSGLKDNILIKINVLYCGDNICTAEYENCGMCPTDCGICGTKESGAIIIPERNCIDKTMIIRTVKLVPRATCQVGGRIIDGMEVCGNLTNEELHIEKIINNTYEEITKIVTDEYGLVTFTPTEEGYYRIKLKSKTIYNHFSTKYCYEEKTITKQTNKETKEPSPLITKSIEKPEEIIIPPESTPFFVLLLVFLIIPILGVSLTYVGGRYYYDIEIKKIKQGKIKDSSYVKMIDTYLMTYWYKIKKWFEQKVLSHDFMKPIIRTYNEFIRKLNIMYERYKKEIIYYYKAYMPKPKPKIFSVPFYNVPNITPKHLAELVTISSAQHILKDTKVSDLMPKIKQVIRTNDTANLIFIAQALAAVGLKVHYATTKNYKKGDIAVEHAKGILRKGGKFEKKEYLLSEVKKKVKKNAIAIIQVYATDPETKKPVRSIFPIVGYEKDNIILHDYIAGQKERKISAELLHKAWRNANYAVVFVNKK